MISATSDKGDFWFPQTDLQLTLTASDVNGDYDEILMDLIYPDGYREEQPAIAIPAGYDGNVGPITLVLPIDFRVDDYGTYQFAFRIKDDTNRKSSERRVSVRAR